MKKRKEKKRKEKKRKEKRKEGKGTKKQRIKEQMEVKKNERDGRYAHKYRDAPFVQYE